MTQDEWAMLELLEEIFGILGNARKELGDTRESMVRLEQHCASMSQSLDHLRVNLDQIEDRLDLHGEAA
ncbi:hypothetical protein [Teichococcus oryzae]|uniref:Uncharacterized protein n=1 Tax=Teichococcus oryzae TaxID=1608942 RepID=A0A5B2TAF1_9PROT|nr:hypothetical protein [Pseudoroseomonas oryzae]KAA2211547.1 hypothetical protein F0Q34_19560 [Pseudoroseomonas oryzae]